MGATARARQRPARSNLRKARGRRPSAKRVATSVDGAAGVGAAGDAIGDPKVRQTLRPLSTRRRGR
jgi:hypothetical protein